MGEPETYHYILNRPSISDVEAFQECVAQSPVRLPVESKSEIVPITSQKLPLGTFFNPLSLVSSFTGLLLSSSDSNTDAERSNFVQVVAPLIMVISPIALYMGVRYLSSRCRETEKSESKVEKDDSICDYQSSISLD